MAKNTRMKRWLGGGILLILIILGLIFHTQVAQASYNFFYRSPCDTPIPYKIGEVDPQFNLSRDAFAADISEAESIWDNYYGKKLFTETPKGTLTINLIYDGRQGINNQINNLEGQVQTDKQSLNPKIADYQKQSAAFQQKLQAFKDEVAYWNARGGAPQDEYQKLTQEQADLKAEAESLNAMAHQLNQSTEQFNNQVDTLNNTINEYNLALHDKPEGGIYEPQTQTINIYFNNSHEEIVHTLAHEMGHAVGLEHVKDPNGIMYFRTSTSTTLSGDDMTELQQVCRKRNIFEIASTNLTYYFNLIKEKYFSQQG